MASSGKEGLPNFDPDFTEKFKEIVLSNGITEPVSEVIVNDAGLQGEGFASLTRLVTVTFQNAQIKPLNLFVKSHTQNPSHNEISDETKDFEKEARFLTEYVAAAKEMCKHKGHEGFIDFYPKCYYGDEKLIVLENLVLDKGYAMVSMKVRQDLEDARWAIKTLAKHHAIGHVMVQECGGAHKFFERFPNLDYEAYDKPHFSAMMDSLVDMAINSNAKILERSELPGSKKAAAWLKEFLREKSTLVVGDILKETDEKLLVLGHGDYWNNNVMFLKDKETRKIIHCMAIDFQVTRYNSATIDLSYFLFMSVQTKVRQENLKELLELYTTTFNKVTKDFGHPVDLTYEELLLEYRRKFRHGFWSGITAVGETMAICQSIDIATTEVSNYSEIAGRLYDKWIDDNPDKIPDAADELLSWVQEYKDLVIEDGDKDN